MLEAEGAASFATTAGWSRRTSLTEAKFVFIAFAFQISDLGGARLTAPWLFLCRNCSTGRASKLTDRGERLIDVSAKTIETDSFGQPSFDITFIGWGRTAVRIISMPSRRSFSMAPSPNSKPVISNGRVWIM